MPAKWCIDAAAFGSAVILARPWMDAIELLSSECIDPPFGAFVMAVPKLGGEPRSTMTSEVLAVLSQGREATLATLRRDGWPQATIVNYVNDDERLYFDCAIASQKVQNIGADNRVSLAIVVPYSAFGPIYALSMSGHAEWLNGGAELSRVLDIWKDRYPYMSRRLDGDLTGFAFYAVRPITITMLDYTTGLGHRR